MRVTMQLTRGIVLPDSLDKRLNGTCSVSGNVLITVMLYQSIHPYMHTCIHACIHTNIHTLHVCLLSSHLFWTSGLWTYQPGPHRRQVTQDFSTLPSAVLALIFLAVQPPFSLVGREVEFCVPTN